MATFFSTIQLSYNGQHVIAGIQHGATDAVTADANADALIKELLSVDGFSLLTDEQREAAHMYGKRAPRYKKFTSFQPHDPRIEFVPLNDTIKLYAYHGRELIGDVKV